MKKLAVFLAAGALALVSCSPSIYRMDLQMRQPSVSGYSLGGKDLGVVYVSDGKDTVLAKGLAEGFASALEDDYYGVRGAVDIYTMNVTPGADYSSRDTLLNLVMDTGKDVVFLFETARQDDDKLFLRLHVYDSMGKADTVRTFSGIRQIAGKSASAVGQESSGKFLSQWLPEIFYFYYYDSGEWSRAMDDANSFKWHSAISRWLNLVTKVKDGQKVHAALNLATAFYILGDYGTSERWLAVAEKGGTDALTANLRQKLAYKMVSE